MIQTLKKNVMGQFGIGYFRKRRNARLRLDFRVRFHRMLFLQTVTVIKYLIPSASRAKKTYSGGTTPPGGRHLCARSNKTVYVTLNKFSVITDNFRTLFLDASF